MFVFHPYGFLVSIGVTAGYILVLIRKHHYNFSESEVEKLERELGEIKTENNI